MVRDSIVYVSVLLTTLIFMIQSNAKIDPKSAAGVWLFDEESGKVAKDSSDNGYDGKFMGKGNPVTLEGNPEGNPVTRVILPSYFRVIRRVILKGRVIRVILPRYF